ncbi:dinitrogenase iron-molybdenum cofactor biosynthesis protein [Thiocystis violacea]|uniref:dinitrogenase iron-molybdenum cofactor biosynthesis protein n=1 Tax=Thiocystis violacea TaxID=13725 RepID=UPI001904CAD8|nr:dinitrogenase iron-molybdenum cofactor biosynthesis protein [Thiocystis violacea]MBK1717669.1 dinitrogenase iron-molybdenum cofactor biosynthesis protein [Thiocystis violacea]
MANGSLSEDIALRIGLAARTLPDTEPARLIRVLADAVGLPPTAESLAGLKVKDLKQAADGEFAHLDPSELKAALAILKGEGLDAPDVPPAIEPYADGDMPDSIRVACASDHGEDLDGHFGAARRFLVYQVSAAEHRLIDVREVDESQAGDDKNAYRAGLIADCQVLYVASIGGPAAAKVVKKDIHPIKDANGGGARERMTALQTILAGKAPPWLAKAMGHAPEERIRFERDETEA